MQQAAGFIPPMPLNSAQTVLRTIPVCTFHRHGRSSCLLAGADKGYGGDHRPRSCARPRVGRERKSPAPKAPTLAPVRSTVSTKVCKPDGCRSFQLRSAVERVRCEVSDSAPSSDLQGVVPDDLTRTPVLPTIGPDLE
jgi:hypothetical protein